ncbi:hypothetical protein ORV05_04780 [Amycolatopsis cynarae]|uniref:MFS transporter n=1 Tax=Amycolatopsis cynarae TaxID=2995223 RepID=A0ABY7B453_9PSEU|nr:hypothetical protein [Amycolatopsis sp. HUAS 11-8]WAL67106.1 hypothetical protein ORV05_04780 [Amycolatopsis sp. HUAS 11-8]
MLSNPLPEGAARALSVSGLALGDLAAGLFNDLWFLAAALIAYAALRLQPWDPADDAENRAARALEAE